MYREVEVIFDRVDRTQLLQPANMIGHRGNRLHRTDVVSRWDHIESRHVFAKYFSLALGYRSPIFTKSNGSFKKRVVDVGDVLHVLDIMTAIAPTALQHIKGDVSRRMPNMCRVIRGDPADVHGRGLSRSCGANLTGRRIK